MKMEMKYVAPEVEVLEVALEKGFQSSASTSDPDLGGGGNQPEW